MADLVVIFRTHSDVEASIVRALLEANGVPSVVASDVPHSIFPLTVSGLGEVRLSVRDGVSAQDFKSALQEFVQGHNRPLPEYRVVGAVGPDHRKQFDVEVLVAGESLARATGASKKEAEQEAARLALGRLAGQS